VNDVTYAHRADTRGVAQSEFPANRIVRPFRVPWLLKQPVAAEPLAGGRWGRTSAEVKEAVIAFPPRPAEGWGSDGRCGAISPDPGTRFARYARVLNQSPGSIPVVKACATIVPGPGVSE
jgi:hypothetical protein